MRHWGRLRDLPRQDASPPAPRRHALETPSARSWGWKAAAGLCDSLQNDIATGSQSHKHATRRVVILVKSTNNKLHFRGQVDPGGTNSKAMNLKRHLLFSCTEHTMLRGHPLLLLEGPCPRNNDTTTYSCEMYGQPLKLVLWNSQALIL